MMKLLWIFASKSCHFEILCTTKLVWNFERREIGIARLFLEISWKPVGIDGIDRISINLPFSRSFALPFEDLLTTKSVWSFEQRKVGIARLFLEIPWRPVGIDSIDRHISQDFYFLEALRFGINERSVHSVLSRFSHTKCRIIFWTCWCGVIRFLGRRDRSFF
jgi:hypothetical protein